MKLRFAAAPILAAVAIASAPAASAQTTTQTSVSTGTSMNNGVATTTTKVVHIRKHKTRRPKKILGVKVGHKTIKHKTVRETTTSSNGDTSTTVHTQ